MKKEKQTSSFQTFSLWWHIVPEIWNLFAWPSVTLLGSCFGIASVSKPRLVKSTCCSTWSRAAVPGCRTTAWQVRAGFPLNTLWWEKNKLFNYWDTFFLSKYSYFGQKGFSLSGKLRCLFLRMVINSDLLLLNILCSTTFSKYLYFMLLLHHLYLMTFELNCLFS